MLKKLMIRLLLGWKKKDVFEMVSLRGRLYVLKIYPYEPAEELIARIEKALQGQDLDV